MNWTPQQDQALQAVARWLRSPDGRRVFRLFGYAGTGKTTLAKHIAQGVDGKVLYAAFTGKAAHVMRSKGCSGATTLHSLLYNCRETAEGPVFELDWTSPLADAELLIVDECSMVDHHLGSDILRFDVPVLVLGDPAQLPPVFGNPFFLDGTPDVTLTDVQRQAVDCPVIHLATKVREGHPLAVGNYGSSRVARPNEITPDALAAAGQVLVGRNRTRTACNIRMRAHRGVHHGTPVPGDRLVCLRNNHQRGLLNGSIWTADRIYSATTTGILMDVAADDDGTVTTVKTHPAFFQGTADQMKRRERREFDEFDFGYALTVHKAQGSQWDDLILFDESRVFGTDRQRWLYTGITRAAKRITVVAT